MGSRVVSGGVSAPEEARPHHSISQHKMKVNRNGQKAGAVKTPAKVVGVVRGEREAESPRTGRNLSEKTQSAGASGVHLPRASHGQTGAKSKSVERNRATTGTGGAGAGATPVKTPANKADAEEVKSPKGVKRKTDQKVAGVSASAAKTDLDLKAKKVKKQDTAGDDTTSSSQQPKTSADKKAKNKPNNISRKKSDKKPLASKTTSKS